ncbi:MAG: phosphorylase [Calothrix sp. C42_A2020_038]|nr:phosphorylase [Calothrix sp. C42_A2020_038]
MTIIFVPQGAESKAVRNGLSRVNQSITLVSIPISSKALIKYLQEWYKTVDLSKPQSHALVMGLCGGLTHDYKVGDVVLYESCIYQDDFRKCDIDLTNYIDSQLEQKVSRVTALMSDSIIFSKVEKLLLSKSGASVVDMEGFTLLDFLNSVGVKVAMLRVVSDGCEHDLPNLNSALSPKGTLLALPLLLGMLRQPIAATRLIYGSLRGLKVLENLTANVFQNFHIS